MQRSVVLALVSSLVAAGCLSGGLDGEVGAQGLDPTTLLDITLERPLWSVSHVVATATHDPAAKAVGVEARYEVSNRYDEPLPWLHLLTGLDVKSVALATGEALEFTKSAPTTPRAIVLDLALGSLYTYNVTMPAGGPAGASHTLLVTAEGWEDLRLYGGGSVGGDAPLADLTTIPQLGIPPILDAATVPILNLTLTRPKDWTYVLSAFPVDEAVEEGGKVTQTYSAKTNYLLLVSGQALPAIKETVEGIEVITHYHPDMLLQAQTVHEATKRALRIMQPLTGPYPYPTITTIPIKMAVNAFSTPGVTALGLNFYRATLPDVPHQFGRFTPWVGGGDQYELVIVHEFVHNWWGHEIANNNSDPRMGINDHYITEGFTTYLSEVAYYAYAYEERDAAASVESKWRDQQQPVLGGRTPITGGGDDPVTGSGDYYEKTALVLRVLHSMYMYKGIEHEFHPTFVKLQADHGLAAGGTGILRHEQVIEAFSASYGEDLTWFFKAWLESVDLPDVAVERPDASGATLSNKGKVAVPVEVRFRDATGATNTTWIWLEAGASQRVDAGLPRPVVHIHADPMWRLDESDKTNNVWGTASPIVAPVPYS